MLRAAALTRWFDRRLAVDAVSFEIRPGEVFALLGPNGAGKTTTLRMLAGVIAPTAGTVHLDGRPLTVAAHDIRRRIGLLTEHPGLWERLSVETNLLTYARLYDVADPASAVSDALTRFGLADRAGDAAATLSKGLKQRVALARTLLHNPAVVLLDEPTAGLDPESARAVRELVIELRAERRAILLSSHNLDEVERVADRIAVLNQRLLAVDTPANLRARLFGRRLRVRLAHAAEPWAASLTSVGSHVVATGDTLTVSVSDLDADTPVIVRALVEAGAEIREVGPDTVSLEEVYLRLVRQSDDRGAA